MSAPVREAPVREVPVREAPASPWLQAKRRFMRNRIAMGGLALLALLVAAALFGPFLCPWSYDALDKQLVWAPPLTGGHLLGTDALGRDMLARVLMGLGVSLLVAMAATAVSLLIGLMYGAVAGYVGGMVDEVMMRIVDMLYSLPFIFFVILLMVTFGKNFILMFLAIGAVEWLTMARIVRAQSISLRQKEFIEAARVAGLTHGAILTRHIAPNLLGPVFVYASLAIPGVIMAESFLSFLGLGVQPPMASLGTLVNEGARDMELAPWLLIFPALVMALTLSALGIVGDGLREALDPKER